MAYVEGTARNQLVLLPEAIDDYVEEDNPVQVIDVFVDSLDMQGLGFKYGQPKATGRPPYNPADMLKLYLYGYLNRIRSSRRLEKECGRNVEVMWLLRKLRPDFKTIADFRKDNRTAIKGVYRSFTVLCKKLELFGGELVGVDGSKFKASNSKKRNYSEARLKKAIKKIDEDIDEYLRGLDEEDKAESSPHRATAEELKEKIKLLKDRGKRYRELLTELEESDETQVSLTDPDSRRMRHNGRVEVCYNVQTSVDSKYKLIVDYEVTRDINDVDQLSRMSKRAKEIMEVEDLEVVADKGYYNPREIKECVDNRITPYIPEPTVGVPGKGGTPHAGYRRDNFLYDAGEDVYICPRGSKLRYRGEAVHNGKQMRRYRSGDCRLCDVREKCTKDKWGRAIYRWEHEDILEAMRQRVKAEKEKVKTRQYLCEHPFGTIKRSFNQGYMLLRGIDKVGAEISLSVLAYNIKRALNILGTLTLIQGIRLASSAAKGEGAPSQRNRASGNHQPLTADTRTPFLRPYAIPLQ